MIVHGAVRQALRVGDRHRGPTAAKPVALFFAGPFVCSTVTITTTALLVRALRITTYGAALALALALALG